MLQKEEGPRWPKRQKAPEEHNILKQNKYEEIFFFFFKGALNWYKEQKEKVREDQSQ